MPLEFTNGFTVTIVPPQVPTIRVSPPNSSVIVVPVVGPQGPPGGNGFRHDQPIPAAVLTIAHNLGRYPAAVSLHSLDLSVNYTEFIVQHLDINTVRVSMDTPTACAVLLI